jgi:hypothetical protein
MNRNPPDAVKKALRDEVGFGCPVSDCGSPYLEWHHFDPPWHINEHHKPEGMIALCREHHIQADHGAFTIDQLRAFKSNAANSWAQVQGRFNWMRNRILVVVGGNFYYETPVIFQIKDKPIIWLERNAEGYILLNVIMLTTSGQPRACIRNNEWFNTGGEEDIECPPSAKRLKIRYSNGDFVNIEFVEISTIADAVKRYPHALVNRWPIELPITAVEVTNVVAGTNIAFTEKKAQVGGLTMTNCFAAYCGAGLVIG